MGQDETEKKVWNKSDFEKMNWHDNKIYALAFDNDQHELLFDIDYILEWIDPEEGEINYRFIVAPATLVFKNVYDLEISSSTMDLTIDNIIRENPVEPINVKFIKEKLEFEWTIETFAGNIYFRSVGFDQYLRKKPQVGFQHIGLAERGGISFERKIVIS